MCKVECDDKIYRLPVVVLADNRPILLGRSWLYHILMLYSLVLTLLFQCNDIVRGRAVARSSQLVRPGLTLNNM